MAGNHHLAPSSITLWHALMYTANRSGWVEQVAIPISILESRTQMTRSTIYRSRGQLVERGLIGVEVRGSSFSAVYTMFSLEGTLVSQFVSQNVSQMKHNVGHKYPKTALLCLKMKHKMGTYIE